ncbi:hypoxanthine-guanine phosphoribosyltransferase [Neisseria gonorrhoeae]|uniref:Hypoxanthine-guanine phosphoribosyltransferase n=1 Tax=Neisseria gonorrhoeae TaxID=485 RepID=A0A378W3M6_NEIGO|nr:hypoxanthine-guanine phosphoribosyltransferase [Neisseria gonorrhoeae]
MGGAVVFTGQLLPLLRFPLDFDYVHVSRYGDKLEGGAFNWKRMPDAEQIRGRHVVVLDDIWTKGIRCPPFKPNFWKWVRQAAVRRCSPIN